MGELIAEERRFLPRRVQPGLPASITLHIILLCWGLVWFPATKPLTVPQVDALPVEIISDVSNSPLGKKTAPQKEKSSLDKMIPPKERQDSKTVGVSQKDMDTPPTEKVTKDAVQRAVETPPPPPPAPPKEQPKEQPKEPPKEPPPTPPKVEPVKTPPQPTPPQKSDQKPDVKQAAKDEKALAKLVESETAGSQKTTKQDTQPKVDPKPVTPSIKAPKASEKDALAEAQKLLEPSKSTSTSTAPSKAKKMDLADVQALLNKQQSSGGGAKANTQEAALGSDRASPSASLTASEVDALKRQIKQCWTPPDGVTAGAALWVRLEFQLNPDGTVAGTPRVIEAAPGEFQEVAAQRAVAAVMGCGPYQLPADKYDNWKSNTIRFDPSRIF